MAQIPGDAAKHRIITRQCRHRPIDDVIQEVLVDITRELYALDSGWPKDSDVKFHVAIIVERPER